MLPNLGSMDVSTEILRCEPLETFAVDKRRIRVAIVACVIICIMGIGMRQWVLGKDPGDWFTIIYGTILSLWGAWLVRFLIRLRGVRVLIHIDAIGFVKRGEMQFVPWNEIKQIRANALDFIVLTVGTHRILFWSDVFERSAALKRILYREAIAHNIPWLGTIPAEKKTPGPTKPKPVLWLVGLFVIVSAWLWLLYDIQLVSDTAATILEYLQFIVVGIIIAFIWVVLSLVFPSLLRRFGVFWLSVPLVGILAVVLGSTNWA